MILAYAAGLFLLVAIANVFLWPGIAEVSDPRAQDVSVLIPARNEEDNLPSCLDSTAATTASEILIYDDHSEDATSSIVHAWSGRDSRFRLIPPQDLPDGWAGKTFACQTLASEARGKWLLFLDADARLTSDAIERIAGEAAARHLTFLSCWPGFRTSSFAERLLMPMLNFVVFSMFPGPISIGRPNANLGLAHGACILADRETYLRLGGHALVKNELFEDTRLAQAWRGAAEPGLCLDGREVVQVRMYRNLAGIWNGFQKNFYPAFRHTWSFFAFLLLHFTVFLLPFLAGWWLPMALVMATRLVLALRFRQSLWSVLLHPLAEAILIALGISSFWRCASGRGVSWKGRVYRPT